MLALKLQNGSDISVSPDESLHYLPFLQVACRNSVAGMGLSVVPVKTAQTSEVTIQSDGNVNIAAELPVRFAQQLQNIEDVNIVLPSGEAFSMNALGGSVVAVGSSANSCNMLPVTITAAAIDGVVPGSIVTLYIVSKSSGHAVAVPRTALVEEMGNYFVFVQNNPISFEKRAVEVGSTDGMRVEIAKGLDAGERVVTKGAVALKLSQGAAALDPHAGHVH